MRMDAEALWAFLEEQFPQAVRQGFRIDAADASGVTLSWACGEDQLRPGGTVSGPTLMTLADTGAYLVVLSQIGPVALAVTTGLEIHFLRKAEPGLVVARSRAHKVGRKLAVIGVEITQGDELVGVATVTYAIPS